MRKYASYTYPRLEATVAEGCGVCARLAEQWVRTEERDLLIEINNHPHIAPKLASVHAWLSAGVTVG